MREAKRKYTNLRGADTVLLVKILEGDGTPKDPSEIVEYILAKDGSILGKLDREWMYRPTSS